MNYKIIVTIALVFIICQSEQCFGQKLFVIDGYAGIDTKGMLEGSFEDRSSGFLVNNRVTRHKNSDATIGGNINRKVSRKFVITPDNINLTATSSNTSMTWAEAAGFTTAANSIDVTLPAELAETGCSQYGGKDGSEKGKWRLPTQLELVLILIFKTALPHTAGTGFKELSSNYWSATEYGGIYANSVNIATGNASGISKSSRLYVRCIKDL